MPKSAVAYCSRHGQLLCSLHRQIRCSCAVRRKNGTLGMTRSHTHAPASPAVPSLGIGSAAGGGVVSSAMGASASAIGGGPPELLKPPPADRAAAFSGVPLVAAEGPDRRAPVMPPEPELTGAEGSVMPLSVAAAGPVRRVPVLPLAPDAAESVVKAPPAGAPVTTLPPLAALGSFRSSLPICSRVLVASSMEACSARINADGYPCR